MDGWMKRTPPFILFLLMLIELYIYMPREHPERMYPYKPPSYLQLINGSHPYRIIGDGDSIPPLISNVMGLFDLRDINVLLPDDYYRFFENLVSFSVPYTNNPSPLLAATSPISDLLGVRYILSKKPIDINKLKDELRQHIEGLRTIRYLKQSKNHSMKGSAGYGYLDRDGKRRFSFFFQPRFRFTADVEITEPRFFIGVTSIEENAKDGIGISLKIENRDYKLMANSKGWDDRWIDVSDLIGKRVRVVVESDSSAGTVAVGGLGLSKGMEWEEGIVEGLYKRYLKEWDYVVYKGQSDQIHIYENTNVMPRAFMLHEVKEVDNLEGVISALQNGHDFRLAALVSDKVYLNGGDNNQREVVIIKKYLPNLVELDVDTEGGLLVLSDLYYPGWRVSVNGKEKRIIRAFGVLRGLQMDRGNNRVLFYYRPQSFYIGVIISATTLIIWIAVIMISSHHRLKG